MTEIAVFAMGCFWCAESDFREGGLPLFGIERLEVGYTGGTMPNPTYANHPGYQDALRIHFNPEQISYQKLLQRFWRNIDPFDKEGQFCDRGDAYLAVIFVLNESQQLLAQESLAMIQGRFSRAEIATKVLPLGNFHLAEELHQNFKAKHPFRYGYYRLFCGRDARLRDIWGV